MKVATTSARNHSAAAVRQHLDRRRVRRPRDSADPCLRDQSGRADARCSITDCCRSTTTHAHWLAGQPDLIAELASRHPAAFVVAAPGLRVYGLPRPRARRSRRDRVWRRSSDGDRRTRGLRARTRCRRERVVSRISSARSAQLTPAQIRLALNLGVARRQRSDSNPRAGARDLPARGMGRPLERPRFLARRRSTPRFSSPISAWTQRSTGGARHARVLERGVRRGRRAAPDPKARTLVAVAEERACRLPLVVRAASSRASRLPASSLHDGTVRLAPSGQITPARRATASTRFARLALTRRSSRPSSEPKSSILRYLRTPRAEPTSSLPSTTMPGRPAHWRSSRARWRS